MKKWVILVPAVVIILAVAYVISFDGTSSGTSLPTEID